MFQRLRQQMKQVMTSVDTPILGLLLIVALLTSVLSSIINSDGASQDWWSGWLQNFSTEMIGAFVTFYLFEKIIASRQRLQDLLIQMSSRDNATALMAIQKLQNLGLLYRKSIFVGGSFSHADLSGANLDHVDFKNSYFYEAKFCEAYLDGAIFESAEMAEADFTSAFLTGANMKFANLEKASFKDARLAGADLTGATLFNADIENANFEKVYASQKNLILPDGTEWSSDQDLRRFTDVEHPEFKTTNDSVNKIRVAMDHGEILHIKFAHEWLPLLDEKIKQRSKKK